MKGVLLIYIIIVVIGIVSCDTETGFVGFTGDEIKFMLSNDSSKTWKKTQIIEDGAVKSVDSCEDLTLLEFGYVDNDPEIKYFEIYMDPYSCDGDTSAIVSGSWALAINAKERINTDTILFITGPDTTKKWIGEITAMRLFLISHQNGLELKEEFVFRELL